MRVTALLLAAGLSSRMGSPKPLLDWGGEPLISFQVRQVQRAGAGLVVVVLGHAADRVRPAVPAEGVRIVLNDAYLEGRASSVRAGAQAIEQAEAVLVLNVDQPRPWQVIAALLEAHRSAGALITVPEFQGHRQHPIVFAGSLLAELRAVDEESQGLRAVMARHEREIYRVPLDDPRMALDVNTPEAYRQAHLMWFGRPPKDSR